MDDAGHERQHAAGALEVLQSGPILIKAIQEFGVQRVGGTDAFLIGGAVHTGRIVFGALAIHVGEAPRGKCDLFLRLGIRFLEKAFAHDFKGLITGGRPPLVGFAAHDVLQLT